MTTCPYYMLRVDIKRSDNTLKEIMIITDRRGNLINNRLQNIANQMKHYCQLWRVL